MFMPELEKDRPAAIVVSTHALDIQAIVRGDPGVQLSTITLGVGFQPLWPLVSGKGQGPGDFCKRIFQWENL